MSENQFLNDTDKSIVVGEFLGDLMRDLETRTIPMGLKTKATAAAVEMCAAALTEMRKFPKPLTEEQGRIFVEAYSLGTMYR